MGYGFDIQEHGDNDGKGKGQCLWIKKLSRTWTGYDGENGMENPCRTSHGEGQANLKGAYIVNLKSRMLVVSKKTKTYVFY